MSRTIYFVDSSVFTEFIKREPTKDELLFFHDLAVAYRRGYCYLCGNSDSLEYLCKQQPKIIGDIYAAALEHYSDSYSVMSLVQKIFVLTYQSKLELLPDVLRDAGKCYFIHIPTAIDENWRLYTECCLLTENLDDGDFYSFIAKYYCKERGIPQQRISFHRENGGGSTTFRVLEKCVSKEKMPTLCLADSDRKYGVTEKYPDLPEGDTLASIKKVSESWQKGDAPPHDLVGLDVHEAENLIPFQLLEELEQEQGFDMSKGVECIYEPEAVIVRVMFRLAADEGYGAQRIANYLNAQGIKNRSGANWHPATIQAMLRNVLYIGILRSGDTTSEPLEHLRIVDNDTFETVREMLKARSRQYRETCAKPLSTRGNALLSGFVFCGHCGARLCITTSGKYGRKKDNAYTIRTRYTCQTKSRTHGDCDGQTGYTAEKLDGIVDNILRFIFSRVKHLDRREVLDICCQNDMDGKRAVLKKLRQDYAAAERNYQVLTAEIVNALAGQSAFSPDVLNATIEEQQKKCAELKVSITQMEFEVNSGQSRAKEISKQYDNLLNWATAYDSASMSAKKVIAAHMIERVDVYRGYRLNIKLNISVEQFLSGLDIEVSNTLSETEIA